MTLGERIGERRANCIKDCIHHEAIIRKADLHNALEAAFLASPDFCDLIKHWKASNQVNKHGIRRYV